IAGCRTHFSEPTRRFLPGLFILILVLGSLIALSAQGQSNYPAPYAFNTFAGNAYGGNGTGNQAIFNNPYATAVDSAGNVYVADTSNFAVRKITPAGVVTTLAGLAGTSGSTNGTGSDARFHYPAGIGVDSVGNVYVADTYNYTIRQITSAGSVSTFAGTAGASGNANGTGSAALFSFPNGVAVGGGNVYVADTWNCT